jgi:DNA sulfur modification protein DndC
VWPGLVSADLFECGGGADTLTPLLHWWVCHLWDWLVQADVELGFPTFEIAEVYGHDPQDDLGETEPMNAQTGCIGCPLVQEDLALERVLANPKLEYLAPLRQLCPLYWQVKKPQYRLRKHREVKKDGTLAKKQGRLGPLTLETREWMLGEILRIQDEVNRAAAAVGQPAISLINDEDLDRIRVLIDEKTWPEKWDGTEHRGDEWLPEILSNGSIQPLLFSGD